MAEKRPARAAGTGRREGKSVGGRRAEAADGGAAMKVKDVMVKDVVTIDSLASLVDAARRMRDENVGLLPVVEGDRVHGVVTDRDLVVRAMAENADPSATRVVECASTDPICARPDWSLDQALNTMAQAQVGRLPVIDDRDHVVGIVTLSSLALRSREKEEALEAAAEVSRRSARAS
jgi:CBS domain-containing protein